MLFRSACGDEQQAQVATDIDARNLPAPPPTQQPQHLVVTSFFTRSEAETVEAMAARLIPGDETDPGAREASVPAYIDGKLASFQSFATPTYFEPPFAKPAAYGASKAGVVSLTRYYARLWGPYGVRVNALSPGGVRADQDPEFVRKYCERVPLGRMAEPEDLVGALLFLASEASSYVTGHELRVDGGFTA